VFNQTATPYNLLDPVTNEILLNTVSPGTQKSKVHNNFHMHPFKMDATFTIGWGIVNLYATYGLTSFFKSGKDPVLHPYSVGLLLVGW